MSNLVRYDTASRALAETKAVDEIKNLEADADGYNADDDFAKSINVAYQAVRERVANGGPPWTPESFES
jgi:hypothetical protein